MVVACLVAFLLCEGLLRLAGYHPWQYQDLYSKEPTVHEPDHVLGWRNKPGRYMCPPYAPPGPPIRLTFLPDGRRRSAPGPVAASSQCLIVGGSYSQGWAVSDEETYAWKLQELRPDVQILNYGTGGYGTHQSLLLLERELPALPSAKVVVYGFMYHHEVRNVAPASWLWLLMSYSKRAHLSVPYATCHASKGLVRHPPEHFPVLPFREHSAVVAELEGAYATITSWRRSRQEREVTEQLLLEMDTVCRNHGVRLFVAMLDFEVELKRHYMAFLQRHGVHVIDCVFPLTNNMRVAGEGHPNGRMHARWAACIADSITAAPGHTDAD